MPTQRGGGTGCHFANYASAIDQTDANDDKGNNIVQDYDCQCNYDLKGNGWGDWVDQWMQHATPKPGLEWQGWFGRGKAPSFALDFAACWLNNPRDMIQLQNQIYYRREGWSNQLMPSSNWDPHRPSSLRPYWGWNEVPVVGSAMDNPANWDAIYIKLPAAACGGGKDSVQCLSSGAAQQLEWDLDAYTNKKILVPGVDNVHRKPGSAIVFLNEESSQSRWGSPAFQRRFACEAWTSPSKKYKIVMSQSTCYIDWA